MSETFRPEALIHVRKTLKLTQAEMAERMGMSERALQDLERGKSKIRRIHFLAMEHVTMMEAIAREDCGLALPSMRGRALRLTALITGERR